MVRRLRAAGAACCSRSTMMLLRCSSSRSSRRCRWPSGADAPRRCSAAASACGEKGASSTTGPKAEAMAHAAISRGASEGSRSMSRPRWSRAATTVGSAASVASLLSSSRFSCPWRSAACMRSTCSCLQSASALAASCASCSRRRSSAILASRTAARRSAASIAASARACAARSLSARAIAPRSSRAAWMRAACATCHASAAAWPATLAATAAGIMPAPPMSSSVCCAWRMASRTAPLSGSSARHRSKCATASACLPECASAVPVRAYPWRGG